MNSGPLALSNKVSQLMVGQIDRNRLTDGQTARGKQTFPIYFNLELAQRAHSLGITMVQGMLRSLSDHGLIYRWTDGWKD